MLKVQNNIMASRYELYVEGEVVCALRYRMQGGQMWMLNMEIPAARMSQKNIDAFLVQVFQDVHRRRLETLPFSPKARAFVVRNPTYLQLLPSVAPGHFPNLHRVAALHQRRKKALRAAASLKKANAPKPGQGLGANPPSMPVTPPAPDQNDLNLAS